MIEKYLEHGLKNAKTAEQLSREIGMSKRKIQAAIATERIGGSLILASCGEPCGYYLPSDEPEKALREIVRFRKAIERRARGCFMATRTARQEEKRLREVVEGQQALNLEANKE